MRGDGLRVQGGGVCDKEWERWEGHVGTSILFSSSLEMYVPIMAASMSMSKGILLIRCI